MSLRVVDPTPNRTVHRRNPGFPLDLDWVERVRMNRSALERRAATIGTRRTVKKDHQLAWLRQKRFRPPINSLLTAKPGLDAKESTQLCSKEMPLTRHLRRLSKR